MNNDKITVMLKEIYGMVKNINPDAIDSKRILSDLNTLKATEKEIIELEMGGYNLRPKRKQRLHQPIEDMITFTGYQWDSEVDTDPISTSLKNYFEKGGTL